MKNTISFASLNSEDGEYGMIGRDAMERFMENSSLVLDQGVVAFELLAKIIDYELVTREGDFIVSHVDGEKYGFVLDSEEQALLRGIEQSWIDSRK